jgi:hypothetical protein
MKADRPHYITEKKVNVLVQFGLEPESEMAGVPFALDLIKAPRDNQVARLMLANLAMSRPFAAPPALPAERSSALRAALVATVGDPVFLAAARKAGRDISLFKGEQIEALLRESYALPHDIVQRTADVSSAK